MARRLNWQERAFDFKAKRALKDEEEFRKTDWAARFIARAEQSPVGASLRPPRGSLGDEAEIAAIRRASSFVRRLVAVWRCDFIGLLEIAT
jgi:hypothetical protein